MSTGEGTIEIDIQEWHEFLVKHSGVDDGMCFVFGPPEDRGDWVSIPFAWGSDDSPESWAEPPKFLAKAVAKGVQE